MTKRKGIASKLFIALVLLTLISSCFLGSTFARYTSGGSGTASTEVAKWDIGITNADSITAGFGKLSPAKEAYTDTPRTHSTGKIEVATITNGGEVDALVTVSASEEDTIVLLAGKSYGEGIAAANATEAEVKALFSIQLYSGSVADSATLISDEIELAAGDTIHIYAEVVWASADENSGDDQGAMADKLDTWVGENVEKVTYDISYLAVQNSEQP